MGDPIFGTGLGLRRELLSSLSQNIDESIDFFEIAPENWIGIGGKWGNQLQQINEKVPFVCHGLSLSLGGPAPLDTPFIQQIKTFLDTFNIAIYSEHLSYCSDHGHLYDLLPLPFTEEAVMHVSSRIKEVQDRLERRIAIENISYYLIPEQTMTEVEFINAVLSEAQCDLLLDINNIYVNGTNHGYDPYDFLTKINPANIRYLHVAGHFQKSDGFIIDSHGSDVIDPVWHLLQRAYQLLGVMPTLLERDFNIPNLSTLLEELHHIKHLQNSLDH